MTQPGYKQTGISTTPNIKDDLDASQLVFQHIQRCLVSMAGMDVSVFETNVRGLMALLPEFKRNEVYENEDDFTTRSEKYIYKKFCGIDMGTPQNPIMDNDKDDISYDPRRETTIISPILKEFAETDYEKLFELLMRAIDELGLLYSYELSFKDIGNVPSKDPIPQRILNLATDALSKIVVENREHVKSYLHLVNALPFETPCTPLLMMEGQSPMPASLMEV